MMSWMAMVGVLTAMGFPVSDEGVVRYDDTNNTRLVELFTNQPTAKTPTKAETVAWINRKIPVWVRTYGHTYRGHHKTEEYFSVSSSCKLHWTSKTWFKGQYKDELRVEMNLRGRDPDAVRVEGPGNGNRVSIRMLSSDKCTWHPNLQHLCKRRPIAYLSFRRGQKDHANRMGKSFKHLITLCNGGKKPEPF